MDHLGATTPEEATARLVDVAADRGVDTLRAMLAAMEKSLPLHVRLISSGKISPVTKDYWIVAGTGARVVSCYQQGGTVHALGTARLVSRNQRDGWVYACDNSYLISRHQQGGHVCIYDTLLAFSLEQQGGSFRRYRSAILLPLSFWHQLP
jgi:hypothetical protein